MLVAEVGAAKLREMQRDEIVSVLIARLVREVQHFAANSVIQEDASTDEIWSRFLEHLNGRTSSPKG